MSLKTIALGLVALSLTFTPVQAAAVQGIVIRAEGRKNSSCRLVAIKRADSTILYFRLPSTTDGDAMLSIALSALISRLPVEIQYTATGSATCGGAEPDLETIAILGG